MSDAIKKSKKGIRTDRIALPSMGNGGLDDQLSGHFGRCPVFTFMDVEGKTIKNVIKLNNPPHYKGEHMLVVNLLKHNGVNVVIEGGIEKEHLTGLEQVGIKVYAGVVGTLEFNVNTFINGKLKPGKADIVCDHSHEPEHEHGPGHQGH